MKKLIYFTILTLVILAGCETFWQTGDEIVRDVNDIAGGARVLLESPAGLMIPPSIRLYVEIGLMLASGLVLTWQELRNRTMKKTTRAIVRGIETTDNPEKAISEVRANIAEAMRREGGDRFYAKATRIVDKLKIS